MEDLKKQFDHHVPSNPFNYTEDQLEDREDFIKKNKISHPKLPEVWSQWLYDWISNKTEEERIEMIAQHKKSTSKENKNESA
tara:strand:+ start:264 stop:509 length:246 start_codon:yes stop_codon:yes gene_type:complete